MCAGGQKWDHWVINEFALLSHSKIDEPSCEDFELLGHISLRDHCTLNVQTKKNTKKSQLRFCLETAVPAIYFFFLLKDAMLLHCLA